MIISDELIDLLKSGGADIVGFADLRSLSPDCRHDLPFGISVAVALNPGIISEINEGPTSAYHEEYRRANILLDNLGFKAAQLLEQKGHRAVALAVTSAGIDSKTLATKLPHKTVATRAGLGWIGKNALLVTERYGPAIRLTTVLTNAELSPGSPIDSSGCGNCSLCVDACPAHAIAGNSWQVGIRRDALVDAFSCRKKARALAAEKIGEQHTICGICISVCPWTRKHVNSN